MDGELLGIFFALGVFLLGIAYLMVVRKKEKQAENFEERKW